MTRHYSSAIDRARALEDHERHDPGDRHVEPPLTGEDVREGAEVRPVVFDMVPR